MNERIKFFRVKVNAEGDYLEEKSCC